MHLTEFEAPGFTEELKQQVSSWGIDTFTDIQQVALQSGVANGNSLVVSAPTSSGKTLVGEIAALVALTSGKRCIYLVSHKALADQKYIDFEYRFGAKASKYLASVGLSTGDREEGEVTPQLLVATYEKALGMLLSGQLEADSALIVADELQIIGEPGRGPNIEALCSVLKQNNVDQFVALTATVGNPEELAEWLGCDLAISHTRDVELFQEIWANGRAYSVKFGDDVGQELEAKDALPSNALEVAQLLVKMGRGPVLIFTESRREAQELADSYSQNQVHTAEGIIIARQLDLFSEPTEASERLQGHAQKQIAFHTADLTAQERQVIEKGFSNSKFDVCFATSTLAAGVNYPFQTVVFSKLTYDWGGRSGTHVTRSDYRNMSGRAGRLGMHECGFSILIPKNAAELAYANQVVLPENDNINSQLMSISMRRSILMLVSSGIIDSIKNVESFFENTYFWYQLSERNPEKLKDIVATANESLNWLIESNLVNQADGALLPTPIGKAIAETGLQPTTAISFLSLLFSSSQDIENNFDNYIIGLIHWVCNCEEFQGDNPSRFLPYPIGRAAASSAGYLMPKTLFRTLDRTDENTNKCVHAVSLYCDGIQERAIRFQTCISSGGVHRLAADVAWVIDGLQRISSVSELGYPQTLTNKLSMLARRIRWGAPAEALDLIRVAHHNNVPGFGRQRAMGLIAQGLTTFEAILTTAKDKLVAFLRSEDRTNALLKAISTASEFKSNSYEKVHIKVAERLGMAEVLDRCSKSLGTEYEEAIKQLLEFELGWVIHVIDDGKAQNVPDLLITLGEQSVILECKTTTKSPPLINKGDAWAVLQKAADFDASMRRVTLGKPSFDETCKKKVMAANDISLVEHSVFIEGVLRLHAGTITAHEFINWLSHSGLVELARLGGSQTYEIARQQAN